MRSEDMGDLRVELTIKILSYWHCGTGKGKGADLDSIVKKDARGLPFVPGKTLKGLLREGVRGWEDVNPVRAGTTDRLFGRPTVKGEPDSSVPGILEFHNGTLPYEEAAWLVGVSDEQRGARAALFDRLSATKIDDEGQAEDHTLRTIETCVPLGLKAIISGPSEDSPEWISALRAGCCLVRGLGSHRSRGLGRCRLEIVS
jgi:hypothetical protein